jgi:hypothetical protein
MAQNKKTQEKNKGVLIAIILGISSLLFLFGRYIMIALGKMIHKSKIDSATVSTIIANAKEQKKYSWKLAWVFMTKGTFPSMN